MTLGIGSAPNRAERSWRAVRDRIRAIPPQSVGRALIIAAVGLGAGWLAAASWPALAPYLVGGLIGYTMLPLVNRLDRVMPRPLAAILSMLAVVGLVVGFFWVVVPPLLTGLGRLAELLPGAGQEVSGSLGELESWLASLPPPISAAALDILHGVTAGLAGALAGIQQSVVDFFIAQTLGILSTISFVLGLFVLPVWLTSVMTGQRVVRQQTLRAVPEGARPDVLAVIRIIDRSAGTFLRARVLLAILTGVFAYLGLLVTRELGEPVAPNAPVALAALLGVFQLIPELGFVLGFLPVLLVAAVLGPVPAVVLAGIYVVAELLASRVAQTGGRGGARDVHPAILIPSLVALSQFGLVWLFLGAPLVGIVVDLARYGYRRLADPPSPAGVIPGETVPSAPTAAPIPTAYRTVAVKQGVTSG